MNIFFGLKFLCFFGCFVREKFGSFEYVLFRILYDKNYVYFYNKMKILNKNMIKKFFKVVVFFSFLKIVFFVKIVISR